MFHGGFPRTHFPTYTSGCQAGLHWSPFLQNSTPFPTFFQTMLKHFRHLTQLLSFAANLDFRLVVLSWFGPRIHLRALSPRISVTMKCVTAEHLDMDAVHLLHCGPPVVPIPRGLNISVGLMAVSSKAVEKACRPTGGLPSVSPSPLYNHQGWSTIVQACTTIRLAPPCT